MDYKRRNIWYVCVFNFVEIWNFISSADISFTSYHYESRLAGHRRVPNETAFEIDNMFDPVQCGRLCFLSNMCRSVFYQPDSHKCIGCRVNPPNPTCSHVPYPGSKYFRSKPTYKKQESNVVLPSGSDCKDIFENRCDKPSGLYEINLWMSKKEVTAFCDMDTDGGGWTVFQNRSDGSTDFYRNFSDFENGFGELSGEFWLGDEGPGLSQNDGGNFTTYDVDQDSAPSVNMAVFLGSGWWHKIFSISHATLNGEYITPGTQKSVNGRNIGMLYWKFKGWTSLKSSKMMFRRVNI